MKQTKNLKLDYYDPSTDGHLNYDFDVEKRNLIKVDEGMEKAYKKSLFVTATGTAETITLTVSQFSGLDGEPITFIAAHAHTGPKTINVNGKGPKPAYKPGTTQAPKHQAGKAYTYWYNLAGDCFFIKASAEGTGMAAQGLAGYTFSSEHGIGFEGSIPVIGSIGTQTLTGVSTEYIIPKGYHDGKGKVRVVVPDILRTATADATLIPDYAVDGQIYYSKGKKETGRMPNFGTAIKTTNGLSKSGNYLRLKIPKTGMYEAGGYLQILDNNWTSDKIPVGLSIFGKVGTYVPPSVRNIQRGIYYHVGGSLNPGNSINISISAVTDTLSCMVKAEVFLNSTFGLSGTAILVDGHLTSKTSLKLDFSHLDSKTTYRIYWQVIEFRGVKSQQTGQIVIADNTISNVSIAPVNLSKTLVWCGAKGNYYGGYLSDLIFGYGLTNSSNLRIDVLGTKIVRWHVIEFE